MAALAYLFVPSLMPVAHMRCIDLSAENFDRKIAEINALVGQSGHPREDTAGHFDLVFQFDLGSAWAADGLFVMSSQRTGRVIYSGPYRPTLTVAVNQELSVGDDGWDNLEFQHFKFGVRRWCSWFTEPDHQFWSRPGTMRIRLNVHRWFDSDGLMNAYEVVLP